jgi:hypothetical protein
LFACAQALLDANDYLGLSAYGSGYPTDASQLTYRSAEIPLYTLAYELSFFGIDLKAYMDRPVLFVEQVGGWVCEERGRGPHTILYYTTA